MHFKIVVFDTSSFVCVIYSRIQYLSYKFDVSCTRSCIHTYICASQGDAHTQFKTKKMKKCIFYNEKRKKSHNISKKFQILYVTLTFTHTHRDYCR